MTGSGHDIVKNIRIPCCNDASISPNIYIYICIYHTCNYQILNVRRKSPLKMKKTTWTLFIHFLICHLVPYFILLVNAHYYYSESCVKSRRHATWKLCDWQPAVIDWLLLRRLKSATRVKHQVQHQREKGNKKQTERRVFSSSDSLKTREAAGRPIIFNWFNYLHNCPEQVLAGLALITWRGCCRAQ